MVSALKSGFARALLATVALGAIYYSDTLSFDISAAAQTNLAHPQGPASVADLAESLLDTVVNISTSQTIKEEEDDEGPVQVPQVPEGSPFQEFFEEFYNEDGSASGESRKVQSLGSGFVIDAASGIIVTNNHVISDADEIEVNFVDGSKLKATLIGKDIKTDLALLKVDPKGHPLKQVEFGDSEKARIGDWVLAIGNPFGLGGTVTAGIISARKRDINSGPYDDFIQTDAAINRGNSGGPLFDMDGKVIGINTAIYSPSGGSIGIGFAIPAEMAVSVIEQLKEFGEVRRGWLGVRIQPVTEDMAQAFDLKEAKGAMIAGLIENSGVDNNALEAGDVVIRFDGKAIDKARDLPRLVAESPVGAEIEITVIRKGVEKTVKVTLGRLVDDESNATATDEHSVPEFDEGDEDQEQNTAPDTEQNVQGTETLLGMRMAAVDDDLRAEFGIADDVEGVAVVYVLPGSPADEKRIESGDVIVDIDQTIVKSSEDVKKRIDSLRREGRKNALLMLASRSGELRFVTIGID